MVRIPIWIFDRHVHLSQIDAEKLFGKWYVFENMKNLSQCGEKVTKDTLIIQWPKWTIECVSILMPVRKFTQVEVMLGDVFVLGIEPMIRISGDLKWTPGIKLIWPMWTIEIPFGVIVAKRHLHCTVKEAQEMWIENGQNISIKVLWSTGAGWWERGLIFDNVEVRAKDSYVLDFHIDVEEANAAWLEKWSWGELQKG